jgi:hypothetical protein
VPDDLCFRRDPDAEDDGNDGVDDDGGFCVS